MSTSLSNRVQSAYPRLTRRSGGNRQDSHSIQRSTTSMSPRQPFTNGFNQSALRTFEPSNLSGTISGRRRPKTASTDTTMSRQSPTQNLHSDEIENLLESLRRDDTFIVQVDCLANYRTLVQAIDLHKTPLNCEDLCNLQKRENRIIQGNARRDRRFRSLIDALEPSHGFQGKQNGSTSVNHSHMLKYQPSDSLY